MADKDFRVKNGIIVGANAHIEGSITTVDSIQLDLSNPIEPLSAGQISWNEDSNTASIGLGVSSLELGQEEHIYIKNQSGNTIGKGNTVMFAGTLGSSGRLLADKAVMDGTYPSTYFIGIAKHDIANGEDGYVTSFGKIDQLDTSMFSEGDILYADPGTPGALSNVAPVAPNNYVTAAAVIHSDATTGVLFVRPTFEGSLVDKEDVFVSSIQDGEALLWNSANARFENGSAGSALELYAENPSSPTAPSATGTNAVAIGSGSDAVSDNCLAIGTGSYVSGVEAVAVGAYARADGNNRSSAFGYGADAGAFAGSTALGYLAVSQGTASTALSKSYASGDDSFAAAIDNNTSSYGATGANSVALGYLAKASNSDAVALGDTTTASGTNSFAHGRSAIANSPDAVAIGVGATSTATRAFSFGDNCIASASYSFSIGRSTKSSYNYSYAFGYNTEATRKGVLVYGGGQFAARGDAQCGTMVLRRATTDATPTVLTSDGSTPAGVNEVQLPNNSAYFFSGTVIARQDAASGTALGAWEIKGAIRREGSAATTTLVKSTIDEFSAPAGWSISLTADTTNGGLKIEVTGAAATNIRWVATVHTSEVTY